MAKKLIYSVGTTDPSRIYVNVPMGGHALQASIGLAELAGADGVQIVARQLGTDAFDDQIATMRAEVSTWTRGAEA